MGRKLDEFVRAEDEQEGEGKEREGRRRESKVR